MIRFFSTFTFLCLSTIVCAQTAYRYSELQMEKLNRGVVAIRTHHDSVMISWRYLQEDPESIKFNLYRNDQLIVKDLDKTNFIDTYIPDSIIRYSVVPTDSNLKKGFYTLSSDAPIGYIEIPLVVPEGGRTPKMDYSYNNMRRRPRPDRIRTSEKAENNNEKIRSERDVLRDSMWMNRRNNPNERRSNFRGPRDPQLYTYSPGDASMGDVDGDGEFEIILKWDPSNAHDNAHNGYTGPVLFDCYKLNGEHLWRINLGRNIRAGAHYTQFMVYDLDGDGSAEIVMKTADGTIDGKGIAIGDTTADYRAKNGRILSGPEYLTVFSGQTGEALYTTDYLPQRGKLEDWGDSNANRSDRYLACIAYLDGKRPSVVMCRGYYTRTVIAAWDWNGKELKNRWIFDSDNKKWNKYAGQGFHSLRIADIDEDGFDEIIYGSMTVDHNGKGLYNSRLGHGDALHLTGFIPDSKKLQIWTCHENRRDGSALRDAKTGKILFQIKSNQDVGRAMAADIDPTNPGVEMWSLASGGIRNYKGEVINDSPHRLSCNMAVWWDGDLLRELLNSNNVSKYDWKKGECTSLAHFDGSRSINGSKSTPCLQGDIIGDWREEILLRSEDNKSLRLYISPIPTDYKFHTFLQDPVYRISIATQNVAYNQPTQPGFYFGPDLKKGEKFRGTLIR